MFRLLFSINILNLFLFYFLIPHLQSCTSPIMHLICPQSFALSLFFISPEYYSRPKCILGDPGRKFFKYGRKSPWVPTLIKLFPKIQAGAGSWLGTKTGSQSANSFSWVLFVSSYTTAIVLPHLAGSFTKLVRARETFIFYFPNQKRRNYRWVEKTLGMLSAGAIRFPPRIFCFWLITIYRK